jgi:ubiquinol-cytochrome c reductase cytochrome c subunit
MAGWLVVLLGAGALGWIAYVPAAAQPDDLEAVERGGGLYQRWCATCHATDGSGTVHGPPLDDVSLPYLDLVMRTGRMPLDDPRRGVRARLFDDEERELVLAYLTTLLEPPGDIPDPPPGDPRPGQELYTVHCAACHGSTGAGGIAGAGAWVPPVRNRDPVVVAEAVRVGPFDMPAFGEDTLSDEDLGDLVEYVRVLPLQPATPLGMTELHRVTAAAFAALLVGLVLAACGMLARWSPPGEGDVEREVDE